MSSLVPGVVLIVVTFAALINRMLGGPQPLGLVLWSVAAVAIFVILTRAYILGTEIDRLDSSGPRYTVRIHILLHLVPLSYFPLAYGPGAGQPA